MDADSGRPDALVAKARELYDRFEYAMAARFLQRAVSLAPSRADIIDFLADAFIETEALEEAKAALARSIELAPDAHAEKWLKYAQLHEGAAALELYQRGLAMLRAEQSRTAAAGSASAATAAAAAATAAIPRQIANTCAAVAELYMTDLCDAAEAEAQCDRWVSEAFAADAANPSALFALANLRLCQQRPADAGGALLRLAETILASESKDGFTVPKAMRIGTAKMLVEVEQFEIAAEILKQELTADDEDADVISHLAQCALAMGDVGNASAVLKQGVQQLQAACGKGPTAERLARLKEDIADLMLLASELRERSPGSAGIVSGGGGGGGGGGDAMDVVGEDGMEEDDPDL